MQPRMLKGFGVVIGMLGTLAAAPRFSASQPQALQSGCRAADDARVPHILSYFKDLLSTTDSSQVAVRDSVGLGAAPPSKVKLVTKRNVCVQAAEALSALVQQPGVSRNVWVYQLGDDFAVEDPDMPDERDTLFIFSKAFAYKRTLVGI